MYRNQGARSEQSQASTSCSASVVKKTPRILVPPGCKSASEVDVQESFRNRFESIEPCLRPRWTGSYLVAVHRGASLIAYGEWQDMPSALEVGMRLVPEAGRATKSGTETDRTVRPSKGNKDADKADYNERLPTSISKGYQLRFLHSEIAANGYHLRGLTARRSEESDRFLGGRRRGG